MPLILQFFRKPGCKFLLWLNACSREILRCIFRSQGIISTFYTQSTLCKLLCKPKDRVATKDKNNIVYETDCSNCETVSFGESKRSLKSHSDEQKRSVRNCNFKKNENAKHCWEAEHNFSWDQKKKQVNS